MLSQATAGLRPPQLARKSLQQGTGRAGRAFLPPLLPLRAVFFGIGLRTRLPILPGDSGTSRRIPRLPLQPPEEEDEEDEAAFYRPEYGGWLCECRTAPCLARRDVFMNPRQRSGRPAPDFRARVCSSAGQRREPAVRLQRSPQASSAG